MSSPSVYLFVNKIKAINSFISIPNILFNFFINLVVNCGLLSKITHSSSLYNFYILSLNNFTNSSAIIFSVVTIKYDIFKNLLYTTKIESWVDTSNFVTKSTNISCYGFSGTTFGLSFSTSISVLFFILWHWLHLHISLHLLSNSCVTTLSLSSGCT